MPKKTKNATKFRARIFKKTEKNTTNFPKLRKNFTRIRGAKSPALGIHHQLIFNEHLVLLVKKTQEKRTRKEE